MSFLTFIIGVVVILVGLKTIVTQQVTINIQLWGNSSDTPPNGSGRGYATSEQSGLVAILIGIVQIAIGVGLLVKGPEFLHSIPML